MPYSPVWWARDKYHAICLIFHRITCKADEYSIHKLSSSLHPFLFFDGIIWYSFFQVGYFGYLCWPHIDVNPCLFSSHQFFSHLSRACVFLFTLFLRCSLFFSIYSSLLLLLHLSFCRMIFHRKINNLKEWFYPIDEPLLNSFFSSPPLLQNKTPPE